MQRLYAGRREEHNHVEVERLVLRIVVAHGAIHDALGVVEFLLFQQAVHLVACHVALRHEVFLVLMLHHHRHQIGEFARCAAKHLALAVLHVFLYVIGNRFGNGKVFHRFGNGYAHLLAKGEEVVDGVARGEHDGRVVEHLYLLLAKFFGREAFHLNEGVKHKLYAVLRCNVKIGRLLRGRCRLGNKYFFYHEYL